MAFHPERRSRYHGTSPGRRGRRGPSTSVYEGRRRSRRADDPADQGIFRVHGEYFPEGNPKDGYNLYASTACGGLIKDLKARQRHFARETIMRERTICMMWRSADVRPPPVNTSPTQSPPLQQMQLQKWEGNGGRGSGNIIQGANI